MSNNGKRWELICATCGRAFKSMNKKKYCSTKCYASNSREASAEYQRQSRARRFGYEPMTREEYRNHLKLASDIKAARYRRMFKEDATMNCSKIARIDGVSRQGVWVFCHKYNIGRKER